jgi:hypothetical protein
MYGPSCWGVIHANATGIGNDIGRTQLVGRSPPPAGPSTSLSLRERAGLLRQQYFSTIGVRGLCGDAFSDRSYQASPLPSGGRQIGRCVFTVTTPHPNSGKVLLVHQFGPLPEGEGGGRVRLHGTLSCHRDLQRVIQTCQCFPPVAHRNTSITFRSPATSTSASAFVLYMPKEARPVAGTLNRIISGCAQWWPVRMAIPS